MMKNIYHNRTTSDICQISKDLNNINSTNISSNTFDNLHILLVVYECLEEI